MSNPGFYKLDMSQQGLLFAPNFIATPDGTITKDDEKTIREAGIGGWLWFDDDTAAYAHFTITPTTRPWEVSAMAAKIVLEQMNKLATIETYMQTAPKVEQLAWDNATTFSRNSPMLNSISQLLSMTSDDLDDIFNLASKIVV